MTTEIMDTALVAAGETAVTAWEELDDLPGDGADNIKARFPELKVVQGTSKMPNAGRHGGAFYHTATEEFLDQSIDVVILQTQFSRALFGESESPLCTSPDGVAPRPGSPLWEMQSFRTKAGTDLPVMHSEPRSCATCVFSQFVDGHAPACSESYLALVDLSCDPAAPDLATMRFSRTALKPFRQFFGAIKAMKLHKAAKRMGIPSYAFRVTLSTQETSRDGKKWYQLALEKERLGPQQVADYAVFVRDVRDAFAQHATSVEFEDDAPAEAGPAWGDGSQSYARPAPADSWEDE